MFGFEPGPGDDPADLPRRKPDYCLNLGITWPGMIALELKDRIPGLSFKSFGAFVAGAAERAALVGDTGPSAPEKWVGGFGIGADHVLITLHAIGPDALTAYSERLANLFASGAAFREIWRQDGAALTDLRRRQARSNVQGPLRLHRRDQPDDDPRWPRAVSTRPSEGMRALAVCSLGRCGKLFRAGATRAWPQRQFRRVQDGRDGCRWL